MPWFTPSAGPSPSPQQPQPAKTESRANERPSSRHSQSFPGKDASGFPRASSAFGGTEVIDDALSVIRFPGFAGLAGGVVLVEADQQIRQLTADGLGAQKRGQFGEVDKPVGVPAGPVVVGAVDNPEHAMVGLASLVKQSADLFGGGCHLLPLRWEGPAGCVQASSLSRARAKDPGNDPHKTSARHRAGSSSATSAAPPAPATSNPPPGPAWFGRVLRPA